MIQKPRLKSFLTIFPISDTTWGLQGGSDELWSLKLSNERAMRTFGALLPLLTGQHSPAEIVKKVGEQGIDRDAARSLLTQLEKFSLLEEADSSALSQEEGEHFFDQLVYFSRYTHQGGARFQAALRSSRVGLIGEGSLARSLLQQLDAAGFGEVVLLGGDFDLNDLPGGDADRPRPRLVHRELDRNSIWPEDGGEDLPKLFFVAQQAHDPLLLEAMDRLSKQRQVPWMLVRSLHPLEGWVGPLFVPDDTACYLSLEARYRGNLDRYQEYLALDGHLRSGAEAAPSVGGLHTHHTHLAAIAVSEAIKLLTDLSVPHLAGRFLTVNFRTWETESHDVLRVPRVGLDGDEQPLPFGWKEAPYVDIQTVRA